MTYSADDHRSAIKATLDALPPPLHIKAICKACPHPAECRGKPCLNDLARPMLENNQHSRLMLPQQAQLFAERVRAGVPKRRLIYSAETYVCSVDKLISHFRDYPVWGAEMAALLEVNGRRAKGTPHKHKDGKCKRGHLLPTEPNHRTNGRMYIRCMECHSAAQKRGRVPGEELIGKVMVQLLLKRPISSFTAGGEPGFILKHTHFTALRKAFPEVDRLAMAVIRDCRSSVRRDIAAGIDQSEVNPRREKSPKRKEPRQNSVDLSFEEIDAVVPTNLPADMRSVVINDIWVAAKDGKITADGLAACVSHFTASYNKMFPTKYAKFGNAPLVSLDATLYEDGTTTRGDTVSEGLWG